MTQLSVFKEVKDAANTVLLTFKNVLGFKNARHFNDYYKQARQNELSIYAIASENVPIVIYEKLALGVEAKVVESIRVILALAAAQNPMEMYQFVRNNFTNNDDHGANLKAGIQGISDSLAEQGIELADLKITFNEADAPPTNDPDAEERPMARFSSNHPKPSEKAVDLPGHMHCVTINYTDDNNRIEAVAVYIYIKVRIMPIDPTILVEALASARNRNNFYNYVQWRAGVASFFKGFVLNLKEIQKQVKRDTSKNLSERLVGSLLS